MNSESNMTAVLIDPQLELLDQGTAIQGTQYQYPLPTTVFESWNSLFESTGDFPPSAQEGLDLMDSDLHSDESSSLSLSLGNEQDVQFPLSPLGNTAIVDESPGNTSISTGLSEAGASADKTTTKATAPKVKRPRRRRSETEKREQIKQRNRVAASKCRQKKKEKVDELKEIKNSLEARNHDLHVEFQRLRQEIGQVKSHLIQHTECNDPNINRWVENEAKGFVQKLVRKEEEEQQQRIGSIGSSDGFAEAMRVSSIQDPYMGLG
ncbi:transcriptional regulator family: bZIP [Trichoderma aggressivum f. europaeum]|uniref:Transcriptional regulator family: bZIP n=1 Tax=Trichoderma aggressivum f. europaeum TaxID=173218 RepID=A0AAE1M2X9_9HYPO|nr:transcriptional regulator family: bZIP [Trichoderma aggressivum f. europaeum]